MKDTVYTSNFIKKTIEVWQPRSSAPLTTEDAHTIIRNMTAFIRLLAEWEEAETEERKSVESIQKDRSNINKS
jgi:hypothetical protein